MALKMKPDLMEPTAPEGPPKFRAPAEPPYKAAEDALPDAAAPLPKERGWNENMDEAPRDGALVELQYSSVRTLAMWRKTRRRNQATRHWELVSFWCDPISRDELLFTPTAWRRPEGYAIVAGMLRGKA